MTDHFALLDQPRQPWLDRERLKEAFHAKSLRAHPDARAAEGQAEESAALFTEINEAYQTLRAPKRRLQHLLTLEGQAPAKSGTIPPEIAELFPSVASATQSAERALQKAAAATNQLGRSLLHAELLRARAEVSDGLKSLRELENAAEGELRTLNEPAADRFVQLESLYFRFAYLTRWIEQLEEKRTQLANL